MASNIHAVPLVTDGARQTAGLRACFNDNGLNSAVALELYCGCQTRRTGSDNDCDSVLHNIRGSGSESRQVFIAAEFSLERGWLCMVLLPESTSGNSSLLHFNGRDSS